MAKVAKVKFESKKWKSAIRNELHSEQTRRLISYAESKINEIGNQIQLYSSENNMDRTGNLLDSLCWGVYYNGKMKKIGYYRDSKAIGDSNLHEYSRPIGRSVNGHFEASQFAANYHANSKGWDIFFAILAPYWGYWEKGGFYHEPSGKVMSWRVMTHHFDIIKHDLHPSAVTFNVYRPS